MSDDPIATTDHASRRRKALRRGYWIVALAPPISAVLESIIDSSSYVWSLEYSLSYIVGTVLSAIRGAVMGALLVQILVWWQWRPGAATQWKTGLSLLAVFQCSGLVVDTFRNSWAWEPNIFWQQTLLTFLMSVANAAVHYLVLAAIAGFVWFHFIDQDAVSDADVVRGQVPRRAPWTIRGMFLATLVAAVTLACLQWNREIYSTLGAMGYPTSDVPFAVWLLTASLVNVLAAIAAADQYTSGALWRAGAILAVAIFASLTGWYVWMLYVPDSQWMHDPRFWIRAAADAMLMFLIHLFAFRQWHRCGYQLWR